MSVEAIDVLVITALQLERRAIREHLRNVRVERDSGLAADIGLFDGHARVAVIETGAGNIDAAVLTARAEELFRPALIAMAGIAGGLKDVAVGDVVASSKIYWNEGGKQETAFRPRPQHAHVSPALVQTAKAVAADDAWRARGRGAAGSWAPTGRPPHALVAPIVVGEKVLAARDSPIGALISGTYGDAVAVDMEDFGALRGGGIAERARAIAVRGISDLVDGKADADSAGSQPLAAANAAAFLFELIAHARVVQLAAPAYVDTDALYTTGRDLYPGGPQQDGLWERAGGDPSRLTPDGSGASRWWQAVQLLRKGGGGEGITITSLVAAMTADYPSNAALRDLSGQPGRP